jgi:hypothetical protein
MGWSAACFSAGFCQPSAHDDRAMTKRRKILLLLAALGLAVGAYVLFIRDDEPTYEGRTLSEWLADFGNGDRPLPPEAQDAIRRIGGKAVPQLLHLIEYQTPPWRKKLNKVCNQYVTLQWLETNEQERHGLHFSAAMAFQFVGPEGKRAIPDLAKHLKPSDWYCAFYAAYALGWLGPEALPPLLSCLTNQTTQTTQLRVASMAGIVNMGSNAAPALPFLIQCLSDPDKLVRANAAACVGELRLQPDLVVPALTNALRDQDNDVRWCACRGLSWLGKQALGAVPALEQMLTDPSRYVRDAATNALRKIAPEALTNVPPRPR